MSRLAVVTGAMSYIGSSVARALGTRGWELKTLTNRRLPIHPEQKIIPSAPLQFQDKEALKASLQGALVLVNTYWVRFNNFGARFEEAMANSKVLFEAARQAGVRRIVHVSVSNPSLNSPLPYYSGKAAVEESLKAMGLSYGIVRPTLVVGVRDILLNNIAWTLRRFPFFLMPGSGAYRVQPITLEDTGEVIAEVVESGENLIVDAAGPATLTFEDLVRQVGMACGQRTRIWHGPPSMALLALRLIGLMVKDVVLTRQEFDGLASELLVSHEPPRGKTAFSDWLMAHGAQLGQAYQSEHRRHFEK